jgi:hypothetical protein
MSKGYNKGLNIPGRAVIQTAKEMKKKSVEVTLSTGVRARIKTVAASLIDKVTSRIPEPVVPMEPNLDKEGRLEPNPLSPVYEAAVKAYNKARGEAATEALVMFGIELIDPIPDTKEWMDKLQFLAKHNRLDLTEFDLENKVDIEYLYKSMIAVGADDLKLIMSSASIPAEAKAEAEKSFPGDEGRSTDSKSDVEGSIIP